MKNRFCGLITVIFPDGYVEECLVRERALKGQKHFINAVKENLQKILSQCEKGNVKVKYNGDFAKELGEGLLKAGVDKNRLKISRAHKIKISR